eukprot:12761498-Alexandrium_andersonii.AAC.1
MDYYDRLEVNHPDRSYEWLITQVKKRLGRIHAEGQRVKQETCVQQRAGPDHAAQQPPRQRQCQRRSGR